MNIKKYKEDIVKDPYQNKLSRKIGEAYFYGDYSKVNYLTKEYEKILECDSTHYGVACYDLATSYGELSKHMNKYKDNKYTERRLFLFREAIKYFNNHKSELDTFHIEMLLVNYANALYGTSRIFYACYYYRKVLEINPEFYMAVGNYGACLHQLAYLAYLNSEQHIYLNANAYKMCKDAYESKDPQIDLMPETRLFFKRIFDLYSADENYLRAIKNANEYPPAAVDDDQYAKWVLSNHLYLNIENEINDINYYFAVDSYYIANTKNIYKEMFKQLVDSYCFNRQNMYMLIDKNINNFDNLIKNTFLSLYSTIDKIAYIINLFYDLEIDYKQVSGKKVFNCKEYKKLLSGNKMLNALYFSYQEFDKAFGESSEPYNKDCGSGIRCHCGIRHRCQSTGGDRQHVHLQLQSRMECSRR